MRIAIRLKDRGAKLVLKKLAQRSRRLRPALVKIRGMLEDASESAFAREGPRAGIRWQKLTDATKEQRAKEKSLGKILQRTGALANSVQGRIRGNSVFIGSNLKYARAQQFGFSKRNLPARPYLIVGRTQIDKAVQILERHLLRGL